MINIYVFIVDSVKKKKKQNKKKQKKTSKRMKQIIDYNKKVTRKHTYTHRWHFNGR